MSAACAHMCEARGAHPLTGGTIPRMGPFEDRIRAVVGVGGREPSTATLDEAVRSLDAAAQVQRLNTNVATLDRAVVALQTAVIEIAAAIDRVNDAPR